MTELQLILARLESIEARLDRLGAGQVESPPRVLVEYRDDVEAEAALAAIQGKSLRQYLKERAKTTRRNKHRVAA
jgi:hypothetical protein